MRRNFIILMFLFFLVGWGSAVLDTSSEPAFEASITALTKDMGAEDKAKLRKSFAFIASNGELKRLGADIRLSEVYALGQQQEFYGDPFFMKRLKKLDGLTASQINDRAATLLKEKQELDRVQKLQKLRKQLKKYTAELKELQICNVAREHAKAAIVKLELKNSFTLNELNDAIGRPTGKIGTADIKALVQNNSDQEIEGMKVKFILKSGKKQFQHSAKFSFSPALKPGQTDTIQRSVSTGSYQLKLQPDQVTVSVIPVEVMTKAYASCAKKLFYKNESEYADLISDVEGRIGDLE